MEYREHPASPDLAAFVRCFWTLTGKESHAVERVLPDGRQELIVHLGDPFERIQETGPVRQARALFTGQTTAPILLRPAGGTAVFGICFHPGGAWPFAPLPQHEVTDRILSLEEAWGGSGRRFAQRVSECRTDAERCSVAADLLRARLRPHPSDGRFSAAVQRIQSQPWLRMDDVAATACVSPRQLERIFLDRVGLSPKNLASIMRFQHLLRLREQRPQWNWARAAIESGYYDQAHLIADFRRFSGSTPAMHESDWTAMERAFVRPT